MKPLFLVVAFALVACSPPFENEPFALRDSLEQYLTRTETENYLPKDMYTGSPELWPLFYKMLYNTQGFVSGKDFSLVVLAGLSSDEFLCHNFDLGRFYINQISPNDTTLLKYVWNEPYHIIWICNDYIKSFPGTSIEGETKFIRAFCYFYLVNIFGEVPYFTGTDYYTFYQSYRSPVRYVYDGMINDLNVAQNLLSEDYSTTNPARTRINKWAAIALLARVYLYQKNYVNAEREATRIINQGTLFTLESVDRIFAYNGKEAIFQLPIRPNEANTFTIRDYPFVVSLRYDLQNSFEPNDNRKHLFLDSVTLKYKYLYVNKYNTLAYPLSTVLRLAEQYLIRAEARVQQGNLQGAIEDLNIIRNRAGLPDIQVQSKDSLLLAIEHERQIELLGEWGHRWFDLKRWGKANTVLSPIKPNWNDMHVLYPIPAEIIKYNSRITQNAGY